MVGAFTVLVQRNPVLAVLIAVGMLGHAGRCADQAGGASPTRCASARSSFSKGLLSRQRRVIPFDRVRDIAIERPLLARLAGTAKVRIETGGGKGDEGLLDMIELEAAHLLRDSIRRSNLLAPQTADQAGGGGAPEPVIFAMSTGRVLGSGLLNFSLIFIALAFGALQYLEDLGIIDFERLARSGEARGFAGMFTLRTGLMILSPARPARRGERRGAHAGARPQFQLTMGEAGLRRRRGLFTLSEVLIPARRTEAARIDTGWLSGWLGWQSLAFQTLGADPKEGGVQVAAPFARPEEVERILQAAGFPLPPARSWCGRRRARWCGAAGRGCCSPLIAGAGSGLAGGVVGPAVPLVMAWRPDI
jgi:putative membrane protein